MSRENEIGLAAVLIGLGFMAAAGGVTWEVTIDNVHTDAYERGLGEWSVDRTGSRYFRWFTAEEIRGVE